MYESVIVGLSTRTTVTLLINRNNWEKSRAGSPGL